MPVEGVLPVIPTPFLDGEFDADSFARLVEHMAAGVDGYALLGSTGEAPSMSTSERRRVVEAALALTPAELDVVVGVSHTSIGESIALARHAQESGAKAVLCSAPYYFENSPGGVLDYLRRLDDAIEIDLVLYDNPVATKTLLEAHRVAAWARELQHLRTVKLTDHDLSKIETWQAAGLKVLAGDDPIAFRYLAAGVDGAMIIAPAMFPGPFRECWDLVRSGELTEAYDVFARRVLPVLHVFGIGDEIATSKAVLEQLGVFASTEVRPPLVAADAKRRELLRIALQASAPASA
jgi:4-hydroxy-tetrahydrodipicolinate synthase